MWRIAATLMIAFGLAIGMGGVARAEVPVTTCVAPVSTGLGKSVRPSGIAPPFDCAAAQTSFGPGDFNVRLRFPPTRSEITDPLVLHFGSLWQDSLRFTFSYADGKTATTGFASTDAWRFMTIGAIFQIPIPARAAPLTGIDIKVHDSANLRGIFKAPKLMTRSEAYGLERWLIAMYAAFGGLALALVVYNISLWVVLRHQFQLIYCGMVGAMAVYALTSSGAAAMICPWLDNNDRMRLNYLLLAICSITATAFMRAFFGRAVFGPRLDAYTRGAVVLVALATLAFVLLTPSHGLLVNNTYMVAQLVLMVAIVPIVYQAWRTRNPYLHLFILAWSAPVVTSLLRIASGMNLIGYNFWLDNSNIIALALECLVSTLLIVSRLRELSHARDVALAGEQSALRLANSDPLTGLLNRRAFMDLAVGRPGRVKLMLIDIDRFKEINDRMGHDTGDDVLRELGDILQSMRPQGGLAVRLGGEEFALLLPLASEAQCLPDQILDAVRNHAMPHGLKVTVSIGMAVGQVSTDKAWRSLYRLADSALYRAKADGRDRACRATDFSQAAVA